MAMTGSMLEKLCEAAWNAREELLPERTRMPWEAGTEMARSYTGVMVLAMLKALRNPTPEVIEAMAETPGMKAVVAQVSLQAARGYPLDGSAMAGGLSLVQAWRAGIDKAMEGGA